MRGKATKAVGKEYKHDRPWNLSWGKREEDNKAGKWQSKLTGGSHGIKLARVGMEEGWM